MTAGYASSGGPGKGPLGISSCDVRSRTLACRFHHCCRIRVPGFCCLAKGDHSPSRRGATLDELENCSPRNPVVRADEAIRQLTVGNPAQDHGTRHCKDARRFGRRDFVVGAQRGLYRCRAALGDFDPLAVGELDRAHSTGSPQGPPPRMAGGKAQVMRSVSHLTPHLTALSVTDSAGPVIPRMQATLLLESRLPFVLGLVKTGLMVSSPRQPPSCAVCGPGRRAPGTAPTPSRISTPRTTASRRSTRQPPRRRAPGRRPPPERSQPASHQPARRRAPRVGAVRADPQPEPARSPAAHRSVPGRAAAPLRRCHDLRREGLRVPPAGRIVTSRSPVS